MQHFALPAIEVLPFLILPGLLLSTKWGIFLWHPKRRLTAPFSEQHITFKSFSFSIYINTLKKPKQKTLGRYSRNPNCDSTTHIHHRSLSCKSFRSHPNLCSVQSKWSLKLTISYLNKKRTERKNLKFSSKFEPDIIWSSKLSGKLLSSISVPGCD